MRAENELDATTAGSRGGWRRGASGTPRAWALRSEAGRAPAGPGERFVGYGVLALPFEGGDLLAFRRFPVSSLGPAYSAVWHHDRRGGWTFYSTVDPTLACPRYFGNEIDRAVTADIAVTWVGHDHLIVSIPGRRVEWGMRITATAATRLVSALAGMAPDRAWRSGRLASALGLSAGLVLGTGPLRLAGHTPNGQRFLVRPRRIWRVAAAAALVEGRELGPIGGGQGAALGDFRLPGSGLFACGAGEFEVLDPSRHSTRVGRVLERG